MYRLSFQRTRSTFKKEKRRRVSMEALSQTFFFLQVVFFFLLMLKKKNSGSVNQLAWQGDTGSGLCAEQTHRDSLWPRQKPHSHTHVARKRCICALLGQRLTHFKSEKAVAYLTVIPQPLILSAARRDVGRISMQAHRLTWRTHTHHPSCCICRKEASSRVPPTTDYASDTKILNFNAVVWLWWWW